MADTIVEVDGAPPGLTEILVSNAGGHRIGFFQVSASDMDEELATALRAWQRRHCGLTLMPHSASAG